MIPLTVTFPCVVAHEAETGVLLDGLPVSPEAAEAEVIATARRLVREAVEFDLFDAYCRATYVHYGPDAMPVTSFRFADAISTP